MFDSKMIFCVKNSFDFLNQKYNASSFLWGGAGGNSSLETLNKSFHLGGVGGKTSKDMKVSKLKIKCSSYCLSCPAFHELCILDVIEPHEFHRLREVLIQTGG